MARHPLALPLFAAALALGCEANDAHVPPAGPPPVAGGTLAITADGRIAIASDPARASIHVVDLGSREERHRIVLGPEDEPGRIVEGRDGRIHVVLRRAGQVLTFDRDSGAIAERRDVCAAPRGIDLDEAAGELVVACASGELVRLPEGGGGPADVVKLDIDLRDVIVRDGGRLLVSRFRSAELLVVEDGVVARRLTPPVPAGGVSGGRTLTPTVAWRMRPTPDGAIMVHQHSVSSQLGVLGRPSLGARYYGGSCDLGVVRSAVTRFVVGEDASGDAAESLALEDTSLGVDVAWDEGSNAIFVAAAAEASPSAVPRFGGLPGRGGVRRVSADRLAPTPRCTAPEDPFARTDAVIGVAVRPGSGEVVAHFRDPGMLRLADAADVTGGERVALSGGRAEDLGHALFHEAAGSGATCAGCHPEGGDDGHVWQLDVGPRRTQTLTGGILDTAPFHWAGDLEDMSAVMDSTFVGRMGGAMPRQDELEAFARWVDALPARPAPAVDPAAASRGERLFVDAGCTGCHAGDERTDDREHDVGTGMRVQVPALYEVAYHAPYLHDGRAATLEELLSMHGDTDALSERQRADLATYLRSL